ncbi:hypothetical protein MRB53_039178 [Persea americana]|nr:hypothetical protein MRB53_039178 [Persea americana]
MDLAEGKTRHDEWDRVAAMEAQQQAEMDAAAILAEAEKAEAEKSKGAKASKKKATQWDRVAAREAKQQADMDADAILDELAKDKKTKRRADIEAAAMLAEFEKEEAARKRVPGAFDDPFGFGMEPASSSVPKAPKRKESLKAGSKKNVPAAKFEDLFDEEVIIDEPSSHSRSPVRERAKSKIAHISEDEEELLYQKPKASNREKILFDPVEYQRKKQARQERRASRQLVDEVEDKPKSRARTARSPSILLVHVNDDDRHAHRSQHRSRSRSNHGHHDRNQRHSPDDHRRSSGSLRPSFSSSTRRSVSDMLDPFMRSPRSSHHRSYSDNHSMASTRSEISVKKLEAVEYIAGKRLEHLPLSPPKSPSRPAGFIRSRSHTGQYSEGFTHDRKLLRKPSDEDEVIDHVHHDWESPKQRRQSRHSHSRSKDEPWQLKILHEIVRR